MGQTRARAAATRVRRRRGSERGVALIMVMGTIAVLTVMLAELQDDSSTEFASATAGRDAVQAEYMARSAYNLARLLIASEPTVRQAVQMSPIGLMFSMMAGGAPGAMRAMPQLPVWEFADRLLGPFNDPESSSEFGATVGVDLKQGKNLGIKGGRFEVVIVDEDARININAGGNNLRSQGLLGRQLMGLMSPPQFTPLFERRDAAGQFSDRVQICAAIMDWADWDEQGTQPSCDLTQATAQSAGVEDGYYQQLSKPYRRKNAAYDSLEELRLVRGVGDDFWANFVEPDATRPDKRILTVWGQPKVNVNTANPETLLAMICAGVDPLTTPVCTNPEERARFVMAINMAKGMSMGAPAFSNPEDFLKAVEGQGPLGKILTGMGFTAIKWKFRGDAKNSVTTESKVFSIYAVGVVKGYRREVRTGLHAVVDFRNAAALGAGGFAPGGASTGATGTATAGSTGLPPNAGLPGGANPALTGALPDAYPYRPRTDGQVLHFRFQ